MSDTRRDFLKKAALLSGAAGLSSILPASIQKAMAINPAPGSTWMDAEHVVILMQENRSFDHTYGMLKGVRGYNDPRAIELPNRNPVWLQSNNKGETYAPFHLDIKNTKSTWMSSLPHSWGNQVSARNDGKFDQWLNFKQNSIKEYSEMPLTLGYHNRADIPFYYALADAFTVCDQNFCSALTGTNPNRLYFWSGTIRAEQKEDSLAHVWNDDMDYGTLNWATFPERLEDHGISWKHYQNEIAIDTGLQGEEDPWLSNFQDNPLEFFGQYNIKLYDKHIQQLQKRSAQLPEEITALEKKIAPLPAGDAHIDHLNKQLKQKKGDLENVNKDMAGHTAEKFATLSQREKDLHKKAFVTNTNDPHYRTLDILKYDDNGTSRQVEVPKGDVLHQFRADVKNGQLPTVSWLSAPEHFSDHPSSAWYGSWYVSEVLDILTQNPDVWKKTIFILAYDENDGYFDHVPPFVAPHSHKPGTGKVSGGIDTRVEFVTLEQAKARKNFPEPFERESSIGLGYRVPLVIASPWSRGGYVNSEVFDHTSTLQFLEKFLSQKTGKNVKEPNISEWRRTVCGDLTSAFRPYNNEKIAEPQFLNRDTVVEDIHKAKFKKLPTYKKLNTADIALIKKAPHTSPYMPLQEKGVKPSSALPYELHVDGSLKDGKTFELKFEAGDKRFGKASLGAPFNVYAPGKYAKLDAPGTMENARNWSYTVKAGDSLTDEWPLRDFEKSLYHLRVYGPNGFFREFKGNARDPKIGTDLAYQSNGSIGITFSIPGNHAPLMVEVTDNAYKTAKKEMTIHYESFAPQTVKLDLAKSHGWYDFSVKVKGYAEFEKRYAGRVETGKPSFTDPLMGGVV